MPNSRRFLSVSTCFCIDGVGWCSTCKLRHSTNSESKPLQSLTVRNYLAVTSREMTQPGESRPQTPAKYRTVDSGLLCSYRPGPPRPPAPARPALRLRPSFSFRLGSSGRGEERSPPKLRPQPRLSRFTAGEEGGSQSCGRRPSRGAGEDAFCDRS